MGNNYHLLVEVQQENLSKFMRQLDVRDKLEKESVILCNAIKMVSADRLLLENGKLTVLRKNEVEKIEIILRLLFDM